MIDPTRTLGTLTLRSDPASAGPGLPRLAEGTYPALARLQQDGTLLLVIGRHRLAAPNSLGLADGERLTVRLNRGPEGLNATVLRRDAPLEPPTAATLRQLLPAQGSVAAAVRGALTGGAGQPVPLPPAATDALADLLAAVPRPPDLSRPEGLRQAMRDSGSLLEWVLTQAPGAAVQAGRRDFAALLLRLADRLRSQAATDPGSGRSTEAPAPETPRVGGLVSLLEGAAARLRLLQLQPAQGGADLDLAFQIPVQDGPSVDDLYLRIRRETPEAPPNEADGSQPLEVAVVFDFGAQGRLEARLRYQNGGLSAVWWSERPALRRALEEGLPLLRERLEATGLSVGRLEARTEPLAPMAGDVSRPQGGLLSEKA